MQTFCGAQYRNAPDRGIFLNDIGIAPSGSKVWHFQRPLARGGLVALGQEAVAALFGLIEHSGVFGRLAKRGQRGIEL